MATKKIITHDFILSFLSQFAISFSFQLLLPTLPIYLSRLGSGEEEIGVLIGVSSVSSLFLRPFVGKALLRIPEKHFMSVGAVLIALTSFGYLLLLPFWPFFLVRVLHGVGMGFYYTASFTLIANISPEDHLGQSLGYFYLSFNFASTLAPPFGMFLIDNYGFTVLFLTCAGFSIGSFLFASRLGRRQADPLEDSSFQAKSLFNREALPSSIITFFCHIIWGALITFFPLYALDHGVSNPGLFFAVFAIMLVLGRSLGGRILDISSREKVILPCLTVYLIAMIILTFSKTLPMFILSAVIWGMGNAFLFPTLVAYALDDAGPSRGPAMATFTAAADLGAGMGSVIMGLVLRFTNYRTMFLCLVLVGVINLYYFILSVRKRRVI
jgi:predicted MFS family arabinose efflux permease